MPDDASAFAETRTDAPSGDWARPLAERQIAMLSELAEAGMKIVHAIERRVTEAPLDADPAELQGAAMAYARAARAVRMTLLLQSRLIRELQFREASAARAAVRAGEAERDARKDRIERIVTRVAETQAEDEDHLERLVQETADRLDGDDIYGEVLNRPVSEIVAQICKDLGLEPDWTVMAQEAWMAGETPSPSPRPPPLAGEGDPEGVEGALNRTSAECPLSRFATAPPPAGEHASP